MSKIEQRLKSMGLVLPDPFVFPSENRKGCVQVKDILYVSGHGLGLPQLSKVRQRGKVGSEVSEEEGYWTAQAVALSILSSIKQEIGDLDRLVRVVRLLGLVNSAPNFERQAAVIDGASDLFCKLFDPPNGQHARAAIGVAELPQRMPVELMGEFQVRE